MTAILGVSADYHDAAAALVIDGRIVCAAQEERFSRVKHDPSLPRAAAAWCLEHADLEPADLSHVAFHEKPLLKFDRLLHTWLTHAPRGFGSFRRAIPEWLRSRLHTRRRLRGLLPGYRGPLVFPEHHRSHAASAFLPSPFGRAAVLTVDGVGEWATASRGTGRGNALTVEQEMRFPHSLGLLYSAFTAYCGFRVNDGEYKLMGLAPYGEPAFAGVIRERLARVFPDGSLRLDLDSFDFQAESRMTTRRFDRLLGGPPRRPEEPIDDRIRDVAASIQRVAGDVVVAMADDLHRRSGLDALCMAGGVALNGVANGRVLAETPFRHLWVQPAAGDAGGAVGAALHVWHELLGRPRQPGPADAMRGALLGPSFGDDASEAELRRHGVRHRRFADDEALCGHVAERLAAGAIVGWVQDRMEFGPRALGARSILADPRGPEVRRRLNERIKRREAFRPFAPAVLAGRAAEWFELPAGGPSDYMLTVAPVRPECRSRLPAVTHVDGSARVQTVGPHAPRRFRRLLEAFDRLTGVPILVNTSFNGAGEPIVRSPADALDCHRRIGLDALVLGRCVVAGDGR